MKISVTLSSSPRNPDHASEGGSFGFEQTEDDFPDWIMALTKIISTNTVLQHIQNFSPTGGYTVQLFFTKSYLTEIMQRPINSRNKALVTYGVSLRYGSVTPVWYSKVRWCMECVTVSVCVPLSVPCIVQTLGKSRQVFTLLRTGSLWSFLTGENLFWSVTRRLKPIRQRVKFNLHE